ncbi:hypothetical protein TruAng_012017 [Truncatella angustata]|nr:hypothetical protein TruAng_012017 [Truncatella angustata]
MSPTCTLPFSDRLSPGKAETLFHGTPVLLRGSRIFAGNVFDNSNIYGSQQNNNGSSSITAEHVVIGYLYTLICHLPDLLNPRPRAPRALTHGSPHHPDPGPRQSCRPAPGPVRLSRVHGGGGGSHKGLVALPEGGHGAACG